MIKLFQLSILLACLMISSPLQAQLHPAILTGHVEYERKIDVFTFVHNMSVIINNEGLEEKYKGLNPQFQVDTFSYYFTPEAAMYTADGSSQTGQNEILDFLMQISFSNSVHSDFVKLKSVSSKNVLGNNYLITDSLSNFRWKLQSEKRTIAGYSCNRADAIFLDSVYVIAFFSDQIRTQGGPESFNGLPGMILGVVIPSANISWFARSIIPGPAPESNLILPTKGKTCNFSEFKSELQKTSANNPFRQIILENSLF